MRITMQLLPGKLLMTRQQPCPLPVLGLMLWQQFLWWPVASQLEGMHPISWVGNAYAQT